MRVSFARSSPREHRFRVHRPPHATVDERLESRSLLLHDLVHYAVEADRGVHPWVLRPARRGYDPAALREEQVADPAVWQALMSVEQDVVLLQSAFRAGRAEGPAGEALRRIEGAWRKVGMGEVLVLDWPSPTPRIEEENP